MYITIDTFLCLLEGILYTPPLLQLSPRERNVVCTSVCDSLHNLLACVGPAACLRSGDAASYAASSETGNQRETGLTGATTHLPSL